jgi:hypothetical protein
MLTKLKRLWISFQLDRGKLIKATKGLKGIGKTNALVRYAQDSAFLIVVGSQEAYDEIKEMTPYVTVLRLKEGYTVELKDLSGGLLLDESVDLKMVEWLKKQSQFDIVGGFIREDEKHDS